MKGVEAETIYCPKFVDLKVRGCYSRPEKKIIWDELLKALKGKNFDIGFTNMDRCHTDWLILVLSTLMPDHEFFKSDYYPEEQPIFQMGMVDAHILAEQPAFRSTSSRVQMAQSNIALKKLET